jgi:hypothetical protein
LWSDFTWYTVNDGWGINVDLAIFPVVDLNIPADDAGIIDIPSPLSGCSLSASETVTIVVQNYGTGTISALPVGYQIDNNPPVLETITTPIAPGATYTHTFATTANLSSSSNASFTLTAFTLLNGDAGTTNDTMVSYIDNAFPNDLTAPLTMGFEIGSDDFTGWTRIDADGDGVQWDFANTYNNSGSYCFRKALSFQDDNDWLFTTCLDLTAGVNYQLDYYYKNFELVTPCSLEARIGTAADTLMTDIIVSNPIPGDTAYQYSSNLFSVNATGIYYIAFRAYSNLGTGTSSLRIDDINISEQSVGVKELNANSVSLFPNPSNGMVTITNTSADKNAQVFVYNHMGQAVASTKMAGMRETLDLSSQPNGIYMVEVRSDKGSVNKKVVITRN